MHPRYLNELRRRLTEQANWLLREKGYEASFCYVSKITNHNDALQIDLFWGDLRVSRESPIVGDARFTHGENVEGSYKVGLGVFELLEKELSKMLLDKQNDCAKVWMNTLPQS